MISISITSFDNSKIILKTLMIKVKIKTRILKIRFGMANTNILMPRNRTIISILLKSSKFLTPDVKKNN